MEVHASEFPLTRTTFSRFLGCLCLGVVLELFNSLRMVSELVAVFQWTKQALQITNFIHQDQKQSFWSKD